MDIALFQDMLLNATITLISTILLTFVYDAFRENGTLANIWIGIIGGCTGVMLLLTAVPFSPEMIFDTRSVLISTMGMFFGWLPTVIASTIIIAARIILGGTGVISGILSITVSAAAGLIWRSLRLMRKGFDSRFSAFEFYLIGFITHVLVLICFLSLPSTAREPILLKISGPILLIHPVCTLLVCVIVWSRFRQIHTDTELLLSEARFRTLYEQSPVGVAFKDRKGRMHCNLVAENILGCPIEKLDSTKWPLHISSEDIGDRLAAYEDFSTGKTNTFEMDRFYIRPNSSSVWIHLTLASLELPEMAAKCPMWLMQDITERKMKEKEILHLTYHDALTGLYNRTYMEEQKIKLNTPENHPLAIIMGDVNGLKLVNDAFGHAEGDLLLKEVARLLQSCLRKQDVVARIGGDEFLILLPNTQEDDAESICQRMRNACSEHSIKRNDDLLEISISLGYAIKKRDDVSLEMVIKSAERYMYRHKLEAHKHMYASILNTIRTTLYDNSYETPSHGERMADLSKSLAAELGLTKQDMEALETASIMHDIGKVRVDTSILNKPGALSLEEWEEIKKHPETGYRIAQSIPNLHAISEIILYHHERWDGNGYPHGLSGENIPLMARILALVDSYDTMLEDRSYRKALSDAQAVREILSSAGKQFDPDLVQLFVNKVLTASRPRNKNGTINTPPH